MTPSTLEAVTVSAPRTPAGRAIRTVDVSPSNAEGYLYRAQRIFFSLSEADRGRAETAGRDLARDLFPVAGTLMPVSMDERVHLAAFEWLAAREVADAGLIERIKRAVMSLSLSRLFDGVTRTLDPAPLSPGAAVQGSSPSLLSPQRKLPPAPEPGAFRPSSADAAA